MGGEITVSSQIDRGSTFAIRLPLNESEAGGVRPIQRPRHILGLRPGQAECRVLIADDVENNCELLEQILGPVGFKIRLVTDGKLAVEEFERWRPHLILMDLRMPVMDGHEAIRRIRAGPGGDQVRIIAVTASVIEEKREEVLAVGADDFMSKPFREAELFRKIQANLGVEYLYEERADAVRGEVAELTPDSLADLPQDLIHRMREAVTGADLDLLLATIHEVEAGGSSTAHGLRSLAERFEYQRLLDLFGPSVAPASPSPSASKGADGSRLGGERRDSDRTQDSTDNPLIGGDPEVLEASHALH
jgi:CheY-like chemotaxis protein